MTSQAKVWRAPALLVLWLALAASLAAPSQADSISQLLILTDQAIVNGDQSNPVYKQTFDLMGTGITGVTVSNSDIGTFSLQDSGGSWHLNSGTYTELNALQAAYPQGWYTFTVQYSGGSDFMNVLFDPAQPTGFVAPTSPAHNATNVSYLSAPTFTWNTVPAGDGAALGCEIRTDAGGNYVADAHPYDITATQWTPAISGLTPNTKYDFYLSLYQMGSAGTDQTTNGLDPFTYYGVYGHTNVTAFTTTPEPGTLALLAVGLGALLFVRRRR